MAHKCSYWLIFVFTREYVTWLRWLNFRRKSSLKSLLLKKSSQINGIIQKFRKFSAAIFALLFIHSCYTLL